MGQERIVLEPDEYGLQNGALLEDQLTDPVNFTAKDALHRFIARLILLKICNGVGLVYSIHLAKGKSIFFLPSLKKAKANGDPL